MRKQNEQTELQKLRERNTMLEEILDMIPASIYINQIDVIGDMATGKNVWANKFALDYIGYSVDEISKMGFAYIEAVVHPDDLKVAKDSISYLKDVTSDQIFNSVSRVKPKDKNYRWQYGQTRVFKYKPDGTPWQFVNVATEIADPLHTEKQLIDAMNEINRLKNALKLQSLTKRELEILKLVAQGKTDDEIAKQLFIGKGTVHTYRNKLLKKTETANTAALVAFAVRCGLY